MSECKNSSLCMSGLSPGIGGMAEVCTRAQPPRQRFCPYNLTAFHPPNPVVFSPTLGMPSVYIKTYGCQMNARDSEAVAAQLVAKGYTPAASEATADVILLNTCSVRDLAEQKALRKMENVAATTRRNRPGVVLGFLGCMAQSRGQELIDRLPDVDLVIGTQKFHRTADYIDDLLAGRRDQVVDVAEEEQSEARIREHLLHGSGERAVTAF